MQNLKKDISRLAIGSAQFGSSYGISNKSGIVARQEVEDILELASVKGVDMLDTAISYGEAQSSLGLLGVKKFNVITKIPTFNSESLGARSLIKDFIYQSLEQLAIDSLHGVLLHDSSLLLSSNAESIYRSLKDIQSEGLIKKIGISSYSPDEIKNITNRFDLDIVQAPMNLIDRRMETSGCLKYLKEKEVEIHIRSAFLQGLLLMSYEQVPREFDKWSKIWKDWKNWKDNNVFTNLEACLAYPLSFAEVDKLIVGIESVEQLKQIMESVKKIAVSELPDLSSDEEQLINPSKWKNLRK